ncbi:MAG TPA: SAM-dependent methyltransferase, partial [Burkholderiaceae bacterium]|nr:SAM-dependent methyltransferase [Burkholderiaceae bacterium]
EARGVRVERYLIVEPSPQLRERQYETLAALGHIDIQWLGAPPAHFRGAVLANEVLDAMPVKLFLRVASGVLERGVSLNEEGSFEWRDAPATAAVDDAVRALEAQLGALPTPYLSEWPLAAQAWAASLANWLEQGAALLIDYGFPRHEFYHPQRSTGTLMCHYRHRAHTDPLWLPGLNDITAHVDFSAVAEQACAQGLEVLGYTAQSHFLINCGLLSMLPAGGAAPQATQAAQRLISETEMGELFKVLALGRGLSEPLLGFQRGDRSHTL